MKIAIPNKGRLYEDAVKELAAIGIVFPSNGRKLYTSTSQPNIQIVLLRAQDIPWYVASGSVELGITGTDMIEESDVTVTKILDLDFGKCKIALAAQKGTKIANFDKIATKLTNIAKKWIAKKKLNAQVIPLSGALEFAPFAGVAPAIIDQVSTGDTLRENNLEVIEVIFESNACLITKNKTSEEMEEIKMALQSVMLARKKMYIMLNVTNEEKLSAVVRVLPCLESPTVIKLAKPGEYAVHSVVDSKDLSQTMRTISKAGAEGILVTKLERVVL